MCCRDLVYNALGEDVGPGLLGGSNTTVPIKYLDYGYVGECKNSKELENILKVLRWLVAYSPVNVKVLLWSNFRPLQF